MLRLKSSEKLYEVLSIRIRKHVKIVESVDDKQQLKVGLIIALNERRAIF